MKLTDLMKLTDMLAVVLGLKTAEALGRRRNRPRITAAGRRTGEELERVIELVEDVICDELPRVIDSPAGLVAWALTAQPRL
jgi:hypothetical protein